MEFDDNGLAVVHHMVVADKPLLNQVRIFCEADPQLLELKVRDQHQFTPLLLSAAVGKAESVSCLLELGADLRQRCSKGFSALQVAALNDNEKCVKAILDFDKRCWKELVSIISNGKNEDSAACCEQLRKLIVEDGGANGTLCSNFVDDFDGVNAVKSALQYTNPDAERLICAIDLLTAIFDGCLKYQEIFVEAGGICTLVDVLKAFQSTPEVIGYGFDCLLLICESSSDWAFITFQNSILEVILTSLSRSHEAALPLVIATARILTHVVESDESAPEVVGKQPVIFEYLANAFELVSRENIEESEQLVLALLDSVSALSKTSGNQSAIAKVPKLLSGIITLAQASSHKTMQLRAIRTLQRVSENSRVCSTALIDLGAARNLQIVLDQTKSQLDVKASTLEALWTLSGGELGEQKAIATLIGEPLLISILQDTPLNNTNDTHTLHKVATEALGVLCRGPESRQKEVLEADSAKVLMTIIRSKEPQVVIDVLRTLSLLCVSSGLVPNVLAQKTVARAASGSSSTIRLLLNLLIHSNSDSVSVNAAFTLACLTLGNKTTTKELQADPDWSFLLVVKLYYSNDIKVQLHAAAALSVFCFNSSQNIAAIRECIDGLTGESIDDLLNSEILAYRYDAAFHQVVLAKSIEDRDPALLAAAGVKILIEGAKKATEAKDSYDVELAAAATNHIAALIRLKGSGVANGLISIGVCEVLCDVISSPLMSETGRDGAATALGFLTMMPEACRIILKAIRARPFVAHMLMLHAKPKSLSDEFKERWKTFKTVHKPVMTLEEQELLESVKNKNRTKIMCEMPLVYHPCIVACFVRHLQIKSARSRTNRSRNTSASSPGPKSVKSSVRAYSAAQTEPKSLPAIEESI